MTLYAYFILYIPQARVDSYCENQFYAPKSEVVVELCSDVWKNNFPDAYDYE